MKKYQHNWMLQLSIMILFGGLSLSITVLFLMALWKYVFGMSCT